ncbi:hypothetical protein AVEN_33545-1 [Araneus ventricosus]|uniref:Uncharacterized protein n=1 Tax=Araneus ventricosus TaxID=182803 RepID=A0A4Y2T1U8_ARAVE|nr:hypothetical protein AVEN_33545-1 [Araneus ventricosus]
MSGTKEQQARLFQFSSPSSPMTPDLVSTRKGRNFLVRRPRSNLRVFLAMFNCLAHHSMNFAVIMANVASKFFLLSRKARSECSQNEIEHFECVMTTMSYIWRSEKGRYCGISK